MKADEFVEKYFDVSGVYCISNILTGKVYVGASKHVGKRVLQHKENTRLHIQKEIHNQGIENFRFNLLEKSSFENLSSLEKKWIEKLQPALNLRKSGGCPGYNKVNSTETREKISAKLKGRTFSEERKQNISKALKGLSFHQDPEYRKKLSESCRGKSKTKN